MIKHNTTHEYSPAQEAQMIREEKEYRKEREESRRQAQEAAEAARIRLQESAHQAGQQALDVLDERKAQLAGVVGDIADALDTAVDRLEKNHHGELAYYGQRFARSIHDASDTVRDRPPSQLWKDTSSYARKRPEVVIGGMFAAGLVLSRFFKASEPHT